MNVPSGTNAATAVRTHSGVLNPRPGKVSSIMAMYARNAMPWINPIGGTSTGLSHPYLSGIAMKKSARVVMPSARAT